MNKEMEQIGLFSVRERGKSMKFFKAFIVVSFVLISVIGCRQLTKTSTTITPVLVATKTISSHVQEERDEIYSLLAYAVVHKDWQTGGPDQRGHNIGAVLVDGNDKVVFWARNCNKITRNGTQHGEVRLMIGYLSKLQTYSLKYHNLYTSLEPCAQCSGMMTLQSIKRTVYGQEDPGFGKAIERLELDTHELPELLPEKYKNGYEPYPRAVISEQSKSVICRKINEAYAEMGGSITGFLLSDEAKVIYDKAKEMLLNYQVKYEENEGIYKDAISFLNNEVTDHYTPIRPKI